MAQGIYLGKDGVNKELRKLYQGVGGVNKSLLEMYQGIGGVNKQVFNPRLYLFDGDYKNTQLTGGFVITNASGVVTYTCTSSDIISGALTVSGSKQIQTKLPMDLSKDYYYLKLFATYTLTGNTANSAIIAIANDANGIMISSPWIEETNYNVLLTKSVALSGLNNINYSKTTYVKIQSKTGSTISIKKLWFEWT